MMAKLLRDSGYRVDTVDHGEAALAALRGGTFDSIITDMYLPGCDGIELILKVRERDPAVRIVAISADPSSLEILRMAAHLGATATLAKPFTAGALLDTLTRVLSCP